MDVIDSSRIDPDDARRVVIDATRRLLGAAEKAELADASGDTSSEEAWGPVAVMGEILSGAGWNAMTQYQAIALLAAAVTRSGREVGKQPTQILSELAVQFEHPD